jgi:hypothetical protein
MLSLQAAVAREVVARLQRYGQAGAGLVLREMLASLLRKVPAILLLGAALAVPAALLTHVTSPLPAIATAIALLVALPAPMIWGALRGTEQFTAFGASQVAYSAVKFVAGVVLAALGYGAAAIMFGVAPASVLAAVASLWFLRLGAARALRALAADDLPLAGLDRRARQPALVAPGRGLVRRRLPGRRRRPRPPKVVANQRRDRRHPCLLRNRVPAGPRPRCARALARARA